MSRKTTWALAACRRRRDNAIVEHNTKLSRLKHFISRCVMCIANQRYQSMLRVSHCVSGELILVGTPIRAFPAWCVGIGPSLSRSYGQLHGAFQPCDFQDASHTSSRCAGLSLNFILFLRDRGEFNQKPGGATCVPVPALASGLEVSESTKETLDLRPQGALFEQGEC
jgi:hypothetical protein